METLEDLARPAGISLFPGARTEINWSRFYWHTVKNDHRLRNATNFFGDTSLHKNSHRPGKKTKKKNVTANVSCV